MEIKAINTIYKGYKFRSRLEARWGVFLDEMGVKYEYETEGYDLHYNGYYLPDFNILRGGQKVFLEIKKGSGHAAFPYLTDKVAASKCCELSMMHKDTFVLLVCGDPLEHKASWFQDGCLKYPCAAIGFALESLYPTPYEGQKFEHEDIKREYTHRDAAIVARQARFEHGENGR